MSALAMQKCTACREGEPVVSGAETKEYMEQLPGWEIIEIEGINHLRRRYNFNNFAEAMAFTNKVGKIAEEEGHHPEIITEWGRVTVSWWTHKINGLHANDFIMAAKTDTLKMNTD